MGVLAAACLLGRSGGARDRWGKVDITVMDVTVAVSSHPSPGGFTSTVYLATVGSKAAILVDVEPAV